MEIIGEATVEVSYADWEWKTLSLAVVAGSGPSLLGRNWLQHFILEWQKVKTVCLASDSLQKLLHDYSDVFRDELGTITPFTAQLIVLSSAVPRFHRPQPVAYALRPRID